MGYLQLSETSLQLAGLEMLLLCTSAAALARPGHVLAQAREALLAAAGPVRAQSQLDEAEAQWLHTSLGAHGSLGAGAAVGHHRGPLGRLQLLLTSHRHLPSPADVSADSTQQNHSSCGGTGDSRRTGDSTAQPLAGSQEEGGVGVGDGVGEGGGDPGLSVPSGSENKERTKG